MSLNDWQYAEDRLALGTAAFMRPVEPFHRPRDGPAPADDYTTGAQGRKGAGTSRPDVDRTAEE